MASLSQGIELNSLAFLFCATATFSNGYKLLASCCSPGGCRAEKQRTEKRSQKTVCKIFHRFLTTLCLSSHPCPLLFFGRTDGICVHMHTHTHTHIYIQRERKWFKEEGKLGRKHVLWTKAKIRLENRKRKKKSVSASGSWFIKAFWG